MRIVSVVGLALVAAFLASACGEARKASVPQVAAPAAVKGGVMEAEHMVLKDCSVKELASASGGKAVLMDKDTSEARCTIYLAEGTYGVSVYMQGESTDEDAVFVTMAGGDKYRVFADPWGEVVAGTVLELEGTSIPVTMKASGPCEVVLTTAEKNVYVDRIVFTPREK